MFRMDFKREGATQSVAPLIFMEPGSLFWGQILDDPFVCLASEVKDMGLNAIEVWTKLC